MHSQQPPGVVENWSTLQCSKHDIERCGYDHAPVTRGHMRTQFLLPHGPQHTILAFVSSNPPPQHTIPALVLSKPPPQHGIPAFVFSNPPPPNTQSQPLC